MTVEDQPCYGQHPIRSDQIVMILNNAPLALSNTAHIQKQVNILDLVIHSWTTSFDQQSSHFSPDIQWFGHHY